MSKDYIDGKTAIPDEIDIIRCRECVLWRPSKDIVGGGTCVWLSLITRGGFFCAHGQRENKRLVPTELDFSGLFGTDGDDNAD